MITATNLLIALVVTLAFRVVVDGRMIDIVDVTLSYFFTLVGMFIADVVIRLIKSLSQ